MPRLAKQRPVTSSCRHHENVSKGRRLPCPRDNERNSPFRNFQTCCRVACPACVTSFRTTRLRRDLSLARRVVSQGQSQPHVCTNDAAMQVQYDMKFQCRFSFFTTVEEIRPERTLRCLIDLAVLSSAPTPFLSQRRVTAPTGQST